jgi:hypothetical protein
MVGWNIRFVKIFVLSSSWGVTAATAFAAALEAVAALATAGEAATGASDDTPNDGGDNQASDHHDRNDWPSEQSVST